MAVNTGPPPPQGLCVGGLGVGTPRGACLSLVRLRLRGREQSGPRGLKAGRPAPAAPGWVAHSFTRPGPARAVPAAPHPRRGHGPGKDRARPGSEETPSGPSADTPCWRRGLPAAGPGQGTRSVQPWGRVWVGTPGIGMPQGTSVPVPQLHAQCRGSWQGPGDQPKSVTLVSLDLQSLIKT